MSGAVLPPELVATDLDGTLLREDGSVSQRTVTVLSELAARGVTTVLVTARPPRWLHSLAHIAGERGIAICGNGAFRYDVAAREVLACFPIEASVVREVTRDLRHELPGTGFAAERATGLAAERMFAAIHDHPEDLVTTDRIEDLTDAGVGKLLARNPHLEDAEFLRAATEIVEGRVHLAFSGAGGLAEMSAIGVTKAAALARWADEAGVAQERVWAFGDMPNDLPMLRWAGRSFAVANAHPEVVAIADEVCASNDEDGVAEALEVALRLLAD